MNRGGSSNWSYVPSMHFNITVMLSLILSTSLLSSMSPEMGSGWFGASAMFVAGFAPFLLRLVAAAIQAIECSREGCVGSVLCIHAVTKHVPRLARVCRLWGDPVAQEEAAHGGAQPAGGGGRLDVGGLV